MNASPVYAPGEKTHGDENFPVASYLIRKEYRPAMLAYYRFARASDDVADHPALSEQEKITQLDAFEYTLLGKSDGIPEAVQLREVLQQRRLNPRHAQDLLVAFRQDARKSRYADWQELMQYCAFSAAPVGRFVLDLHGESPSLWPASDALCSALQIINHLQDCKADYRQLNRVYIPQDTLAKHGANETELAAGKASPALRQCITELTSRTQALMQSAYFFSHVRDTRLAIEVATIERLADGLLALLGTRDPLCSRVHFGKLKLIAVMMSAAAAVLLARTTGKPATLSRRSL